MTTQLEGKTVAIFAAGGAIGSGVADAILREGATAHLSAHRSEAIDVLRTRFGDAAHYAQVDATDAEAVGAHLDEVMATSGTIDGTFNGIGGRPKTLGYPARVEDMELAQFMTPLERILGSTFVTSRAASVRMRNAGTAGSIVTLSATLSGMTAAYMTNLSATCAAIEGLTRSLAGELGSANIRVNCVRASAMPETRTIQETGQAQAALAAEPPAFGVPPLGRPITVAETANTAAFLLSDYASGTTGQVLTVCAGQFV